MSEDKIITMAELEREATIEIQRRFKALGIGRPVRPARLGAGMNGQALMSVREFESKRCDTPWKGR